MSDFVIDERVRLMIELALAADPPVAARLEQQDAEARKLGISGAEIDAARQGRSFDVRTSVALALAVGSLGDSETRRRQREKALKVGISEQVCGEIETLASRLSAASSKKVRYA